MKHASLVITLSLVGFAITLAVFIASRLSDQAVALLAGTIFGMVLALPIGGAIGWFARSHRASDRSESSPMMIVTPPQPYLNTSTMPVWRGTYPGGSNVPQLAPRHYNTIGGEELLNHEPDAVW
jgi:hypothetical protein